MVRRGVMLMAVGWLLLAAAAPPARPPARSGSGLPRAAPAPLPAGRSCDGGTPDRASDLCAQWEAADAAVESARAGWAQVWIGGAGTAMGLVTLIAAVAAALFARKAADETEKGALAALAAVEETRVANALAKQSAESDLRAWLSIEAELKSVSRSRDNAHFTLLLKLRNLGKTPALRVAVGLHVYCTPNIRIGDGDPPDIARHKSAMPALMPGVQAEQGIGERIPAGDIEAAMAAAGKSGSFPIVQADVVVSYHTIFDAPDAPPRVSSTRYSIVPNGREPFRYREIKDWLADGPRALGDVICGRDNSAPIHAS